MDQTEAGSARRRRRRIRKKVIAIAAVMALAFAIVQLALYFLPLVVQHAEGPSAEAAIEWAESGDGYDYAYALEREYVDEEGRTVYRLVSDSDPVVVKEMRYGFRWLPEVTWSRAVVPGPIITDPGPYYDIANEDEWRRSFNKWDGEQMRREGRDWLSLHPQKRPEEPAEQGEGA